MQTPLVTFVIPVYNGAAYLKDTLASVLGQTYANLEILCIDDKSTDNSLTVLAEIAAKDHRIKIIEAPVNKGQAAARNLGINCAKGKYIALLDQDDLCLPQRIEVEVAFMESHPNIGLMGATAQLFGDRNEVATRKALTNEEIKIRLLFCRCPISNSTVLMRKDVIDTNSLRFNESFRAAEDYEFYSRVIAKTKLANIPDILVKYRWHDGSISRKKAGLQSDEINLSAYKFAVTELGLNYAAAEKIKFLYHQKEVSPQDLYNFDFFAQKCLALSDLKGNHKFLKHYLFERFYKICKLNKQLKLKHLKPFFAAVFKYNYGYLRATKLFFRKSLGK